MRSLILAGLIAFVHHHRANDVRERRPRGLLSPLEHHRLCRFSGPVVETFGGFAQNLFAFNATSYGVVLSDQNTTGNPYYAVTVTDSAIAHSAPELWTWAMLGLAFAGLALVASRRRKNPIAALG